MQFSSPRIHPSGNIYVPKKYTEFVVIMLFLKLKMQLNQFSDQALPHTRSGRLRPSPRPFLD